MGIRTMLTMQGSPLSYNNGQTPAINRLATTLSTMHVDGNQPGYSLSGRTFTGTNNAFQRYHDGTANILPQPSQLDLNGLTPVQYINHLPK